MQKKAHSRRFLRRVKAADTIREKGEHTTRKGVGVARKGTRAGTTLEGRGIGKRGGTSSLGCDRYGVCQGKGRGGELLTTASKREKGSIKGATGFCGF